jgi:quercetin 2,3-dioxygenase
MQMQITPRSRVEWNGQHYQTLLTAGETGGKFSLLASDGGPGGGPPRHRHPKSDEVFIIVEGRLRFWCAGEYAERTVGEAFHIPAGVEHTFVVIERARWIFFLSPGGMESFFQTVAARGLEIPRDLAEIKAIAAACDMEITGPPLGLAGTSN